MDEASAFPAMLDAARATPAATAILLAIVVIGAFTLYRAPAAIERGLFRPYWFLRRHEYATPFTSVFLHADFAHLLFNAFTFWAFAFGLERQIGTGPFVALYAAGLVGSDFGTWLVHRDEPDYATLGASGAILAVLFASIVYFPSASLFILPIPVPIPAPLFAVLYLAYTWFSARRARGRVNHDAHFGGAIAGLAFVAVTDPDAVGRAWRSVFG